MSTKDHPIATWEKPHLVLELNGEEVNYLQGVLANGDEAEGLEDPEAYVPLGRRALLLIGGAFNELVPVPPLPPYTQLVPLSVDEELVWLFRDKTKAGAMATDKTTNVGVPLLHKLYDLLLRFNSDLVDVTEAVGYDEPAMTPEMINQLKEHLHATRSTD